MLPVVIGSTSNGGGATGGYIHREGGVVKTRAELGKSHSDYLTKSMYLAQSI